jgi:localization factor PodJL
MKSGGPWNLRGLRPETRDAARNAARRSGMSVGEWLNSVIQQGDADYGDEMRFADYDDDYDNGGRDDTRRESRREQNYDYRQGPRRRRPDPAREYVRELPFERQEFGEVNARLDRLTDQLERIARSGAPRLTGAPAQPQRSRAAPSPQPRRASRPAARGNGVSVDDAVAEIAERQRALYGEPLAPAPLLEEPSPPMAPPSFSTSDQEMSEAAIDIGGIEEQLREMTARIESLRPTSDLGRAIAVVHKDLAEIHRQLAEAQPRRVVQSLENEAQALAQRIDHSRDSGVDPAAVAGVERGLAEVRDALHGLTPAESLAGFDDAVRSLAQKVDMIIAREDPRALEQLETAIGGLRGIVSHVASNDTLNKVADDIRTLSAKVDSLAHSAVSGEAVSMLENRIDTLTNALSASAEAGHAVPHELEKLLSGLIEKLEWVQLTHTDHAALGNLEDRIAQLMKRLDASDAKLGNLEAVERGLTDLLVHLDQSGGGAGIQPSESRTQSSLEDSLEAVHGTVEQVVDRLAMIESGIHETAHDTPSETARDTAPSPSARPVAVERVQPQPVEAEPARPFAPTAPAPVASNAGQAPAPAAERPAAVPRKPIDPNLPPDHPLEPGFTAGSRAVPSAADRIAASEAAAGYPKPPVIAEPGEKPNFIAAARRAAQTAAATAPERQPRAEIEGLPSGKSTPRLRKLLVAGGAILVLFGFVHVALRMFQDPGPAVAPAEQAAPPAVLADPDSNRTAPPASGPLVLPVPGAPTDITPNATSSGPQSSAPQAVPNGLSIATLPLPAMPTPPAAAVAPARQSALQNSGDVTGSLPRRPSSAPLPAIVAPVQAPSDAVAIEKLPVAIGGPTLRAAALAGDATAEFEVATRFFEGRGVPPSSEQAARWLDSAAKKGLAAAQFRLGGFYEKGIGVKKDLAAARDMYRGAADKGNGKAMHNLAVLYAEGINGPADYRTAAHWFRKAADRGITDSEYNLAILYARGIGVEQNYAESYKWFMLAANAGDTEAAKKRDEVASHLDAQSLAAAQSAVQKWTAEPQPDDAINVKIPPGGWDPQPAAKSKTRVIGTKSGAPESKLN